MSEEERDPVQLLLEKIRNESPPEILSAFDIEEELATFMEKFGIKV